jgi:uncharacterized spore protein YtfJ
MDIQQFLHGLAERVSASASVRNVYGEPVTAAGRTIIPSARVRYAFGGGGGRSRKNEQLEGGGGGGGGRASLHPCGAIEIGPTGTRYISFDDSRRVGAALAFGFALGIAVAKLSRRR